MNDASSAGTAHLASEAATRACLTRVEQYDPQVKAMITVDADGALAAAREADAAARAGRWLGLLHGMPVMVKDNIDTAGLRTTYGSRFFAEHVPNHDAPVVARLRRAGAVLLGKTTLHEFAFGVRSSNPVIGQCRNPWDTSRIPGGSSGGSGVAVALDMCQGALGSDTGGSVRLPAALNGVSGLRPTVGRIPNTGSMPVCPTQDTIGPMARSITDVARLFAVLAGPDGEDPLAEARPLENFLAQLDDGVRGVRIGVPRNHYFDGAVPVIAEAVMAAARTLEGLGASLIEVDLPGAEEAHHHGTVIIYSDACAVHAERLASSPETFDEQVLARMRTGLDYTGVDYANAMRMREQWKQRLARVFARVDVLCSPTIHTPVPPIENGLSLLETTRDATRNTYLGAFGQLPGVSLPCGVNTDGLPIGFQLEGPWWSEPLLLRTGHAYQQVTDFHQARPGMLGS
jgi:aspartyl-tRNA(Asn)/glutamyl-tRNA(Gln) amidotransferase subunit A